MTKMSLINVIKYLFGEVAKMVDVAMERNQAKKLLIW